MPFLHRTLQLQISSFLLAVHRNPKKLNQTITVNSSTNTPINKKKTLARFACLCFYVKFSRTDDMYAFFSRISARIWNSIPYSIKLLKHLSFCKKIKDLLLNFLRSEDDYVEVSHLIKLFNPCTLGQPLFIILT